MKVYSISDILPDLNQSLGYYIGVFEDTPDPILEWPHRHDFYSLVWFTKGKGFNVLGEQELSALDSLQVENLKNTYNDFSPELVQFTLEYAYADIFSRDNLSKKHRQIATISALTALGTAHQQLKFHINAGLNIGVSVDEIKEIMLLMTVYSGFPSAINGTNALREVLAGR